MVIMDYFNFFFSFMIGVFSCFFVICFLAMTFGESSKDTRERNIIEKFDSYLDLKMKQMKNKEE